MNNISLITEGNGNLAALDGQSVVCVETGSAFFLIPVLLS